VGGEGGGGCIEGYIEGVVEMFLRCMTFDFLFGCVCVVLKG